MHFNSLFSVLAIASVVSAIPVAKRGTGAAIQVNSETEFCFYVPSKYGGNIGVYEDDSIPACTDTTLAPGSIEFPAGFIQSAHFQSTGSYSQVTGRIDRTKYGLSASDGGGQMDNLDLPDGTCNGYKHFVNLIEPDAQLYCIRCCQDSSDCNLGRSQYGCEDIVPGDYS
ncbi:hypothetical protein BGW37DRAFT_535137 [Umbelopsis sp. PMI_123]|nr:hypothetical protein BGW37DRAFT_535137 [Umbelopsis sp. PMI_123]